MAPSTAVQRLSISLLLWLEMLEPSCSSVRFMIFDQHADVVAQCQLEFPQYYPHPGYVSFYLPTVASSTISRWHDHDALEIQSHAEQCIEEAIKELEAAGWAKESVKVIGLAFNFPIRLVLVVFGYRHH